MREFITETDIRTDKGIIIGGSGKNAVALDAVALGGASSMLVLDAGYGLMQELIPLYVLQAVRRGESVVVSSPSAIAYTLFNPWLKEQGYKVKHLCINDPGHTENIWPALPTSFSDAAYRDAFISVTATALVNNVRVKMGEKDTDDDASTFAWAMFKLQYLNLCFGRERLISPFLAAKDSIHWSRAAKQSSFSKDAMLLEDLFLHESEEEASWSQEEKAAAAMMRNIGKSVSRAQREKAYEMLCLGLRPLFEEEVRIFGPCSAFDEQLGSVLSLRDVGEEKTALFVTVPGSELAKEQPFPAILFAQLGFELERLAKEHKGKLPVGGVSIILHSFASSLRYLPDLVNTIARLRACGVNIMLTEENLAKVHAVYQAKTQELIFNACDVFMVIDPANYFDAIGHCTDKWMYEPWLKGVDAMLRDRPSDSGWSCAAHIPSGVSAVFPLRDIENYTGRVYIMDMFRANTHPKMPFVVSAAVLDESFKRTSARAFSRNYDPDTELRAAMVLSPADDHMAIPAKELTKMLKNQQLDDIDLPLVLKKRRVPEEGANAYTWAEPVLQCQAIARITPISANPNLSFEETRKKALVFQSRAFRLRLILKSRNRAVRGSDQFSRPAMVVGEKTFYIDSPEMQPFVSTDAEGRETVYLRDDLTDFLYHGAGDADKPLAQSIGFDPFDSDMEYTMLLEIAPGEEGESFKLCDFFRIRPVVLPEDVQQFENDKKLYKKRAKRCRDFDKKIPWPALVFRD